MQEIIIVLENNANNSHILLLYFSFSAPMDYTDPNNLQVTFTAGSVQDSSQCVSVNIVNDNFLEQNVESFFASLTPAPGSNAVIVSGRERATVNIVDNNDNGKN